MSDESLLPGDVDQEAWERASALYYEGRSCQEAGDLEKPVRLLRESAEATPHFKTLEVLGELLSSWGGRTRPSCRWHRPRPRDAPPQRGCDHEDLLIGPVNLIAETRKCPTAGTSAFCTC